MPDQIRHTKVASIIISHGTGSKNAAKNKSIYPVNRKGFIASNKGMGMKLIADPIKTALIVIIIGVTLFLKKVDSIKHKLLIVIITNVEMLNAKKNRQKISPSPKKSNPIWKTAKSPFPKKTIPISKV